MRAELRGQQVHRAGRVVGLIETLDVVAVGMPRDPVDKSVGAEDHKLATRVAGDDFAFLHEILDVRGRAHLDESAKNRTPSNNSSVHAGLLTHRRSHSGKPPVRTPQHRWSGRRRPEAQWLALISKGRASP